MRKCKHCGRNRAPRFYVGARGRICETCRKGKASDSARDRRLVEVYEVTPEEWELVLLLTGHACGACHQPRRYRLSVDHDHKVEKERGMRASLRGPLCRRCNKVLRDVRDSIPVLKGLIAYLEDPPARRVLDG